MKCQNLGKRKSRGVDKPVLYKYVGIVNLLSFYRTLLERRLARGTRVRLAVSYRLNTIIRISTRIDCKYHIYK